MKNMDFEKMVQEHKNHNIDMKNREKGNLPDKILMIGRGGKPVEIVIGQKIKF